MRHLALGWRHGTLRRISLALVPRHRTDQRKGANMETERLHPKLVVIRRYLEKNLIECLVQESVPADGHCQLTVTHGETGLCTVHVSAELLSDRHLNSVDLRWALKERDVAGHVRAARRVSLDHEMLRIGDTSALARRPRNNRSVPH